MPGPMIARPLERNPARNDRLRRLRARCLARLARLPAGALREATAKRYDRLHSAIVYGPAFAASREPAAARSGGRCQACGAREGKHAHHWAIGLPYGPNYPELCDPPRDCSSDDITWLCPGCHDSIITPTRRIIRAEGDRAVGEGRERAYGIRRAFSTVRRGIEDRERKAARRESESAFGHPAATARLSQTPPITPGSTGHGISDPGRISYLPGTPKLGSHPASR